MDALEKFKKKLKQKPEKKKIRGQFNKKKGRRTMKTLI